MLARRAMLDDGEVHLAEALVVNPSTAAVDRVNGLTPERKALVLDSAFDLLRYKSGFYRVQPPTVQATERRILDLRRTVPASTPLPAPPLGNVATPESGHDTGRVGVVFGADEHKPFQEVNIRASIHDLEADPTGYVEGSQLEMFNVRARYEEGPNLYLEEFKLFEIISVAPRDRWVHPPSWTVRAHATVAHDLEKNPDRSLVYSLDGGSGFAWQQGGNDRLIEYVMWKADEEVGDALDKGHREGVAAHAGVLARAGRAARLHVYATVTRFISGDVGNRVELTAVPSVSLARDLELRGQLRRANGYREAGAGVYLYW
jgi:hypothetical protein